MSDVTSVQIVTAFQLQGIFGMDEDQLKLLIGNGCPHINIHGAISFKMTDTMEFVQKHYEVGPGPGRRFENMTASEAMALKMKEKMALKMKEKRAEEPVYHVD